MPALAASSSVLLARKAASSSELSSSTVMGCCWWCFDDDDGSEGIIAADALTPFSLPTAYIFELLIAIYLIYYYTIVIILFSTGTAAVITACRLNRFTFTPTPKRQQNDFSLAIFDVAARRRRMYDTCNTICVDTITEYIPVLTLCTQPTCFLIESSLTPLACNLLDMEVFTVAKVHLNK